MKARLIFFTIVLAYTGFWILAAVYTGFHEMILKIGGAFIAVFLIFSAIIYMRLISGDKEAEKGTYHGSAGFAENNEIEELTVDVNKPLAAGAFALAPLSDNEKSDVKRIDSNKRIDLPRKITTRHIALFGPSGAGKSYSFLFQIAL